MLGNMHMSKLRKDRMGHISLILRFPDAEGSFAKRCHRKPVDRLYKLKVAKHARNVGGTNDKSGMVFNEI